MRAPRACPAAPSDLREALGPASSLTLVGVEHEYAVRDGQRQVDFRELIEHLPIDGHRVDPRDWFAHRCPWGGVITCDGAEAEIACPPVAVAAGYDDEVVALGGRGEAALRDALPSHLELVPFSTHVSVSAPDPGPVAERLAQTAAAAMVGNGCGVIVRARPGRVEVCFEPLHGDDLRRMVRFVTGAVVALARDLDALGAPLGIPTEPGLERPGWYVDRERSLGGLDPLPPYERMARLPSLPRRADATAWTRVLRPGLLSVTWDVAVFDIGGGVAAVPAPWLGRYLTMLDAGDLDDVLTRAPRHGRLRSWAQTSTPGTYATLGDPVGLVTPELDAGATTGTAASGKEKPPGQAETTTFGWRRSWWIHVLLLLVGLAVLLWLVLGGDDDGQPPATSTTTTSSITTTTTGPPVTTVTTAAAAAGAPPGDIAVVAFFDQATYTTYYEASATDPDGDVLTYDWDLRFTPDQEDCGVFTHDGAQAAWQHPHESQRGVIPGFPDDRYCRDDLPTGRHEGTIVLSVSDGSDACVVTWDRGSEDGELRGIPCG